ncbi:MAG: excinuclease ABC subunit UvrC [Pseudomonadota bacterium]|nr:excinuclease ABC subunit UvrC [Pseudomonadota bacterium]MDE3037400.1 excinuclease ABC subunit UvrC [Pseudomonadota bacterium]
METPRLSEGLAVIKNVSRNVPETPGVYRMVDAKGEVLYVGKAKHLKARISSYVNAAALNARLQRMIAQTASMEIITTRSEAEALLLEANLIKKFMPRYNILLKDDKSFPYIFFSGDHEFARISKHRGAKVRKGKYFGPFVSAGAVDETLTTLQKLFLLRSCPDNVFKNRTRPCMLYQIKRCSAPCVGKIKKEEYNGLVNQAFAFLTGRSSDIHDALVAEMHALSLKMHYEKARVVRDRIRALAQVQQQHKGEAAVGDADIIALARNGKDYCIQLFSFRGGGNYGNRAWFPLQAAAFDDAEILRNFIAWHYQPQPAPPLILTSHLLMDAGVLEEALRLHSDYKIEIVHPLRGEKRSLVEQAAKNAREALMRRLSLQANMRDMMEGVRKLFGLEDVPERIEVYDNSHISGADAVGAMIVVGPEGFLRPGYRKFNIRRKETAPGDDYAMVREVLMRRFMRLQEEDGKLPDLVLIDGGAGQVGAAAKVFEELGVSVAYAGIAKGPDRNAGREMFFIPGKEPFQLPVGDPLLHFLQRLRDEAHRFAIGAHRARRDKSMSRSELDAIPFIGPQRKKSLLHHFGSARAVAAASMDDIAKAEGISTSTAKIIYEHFHGEQ